MNFSYGKIFREICSVDKISIKIVPYLQGDDTDYYKFIRKQKEKGLIQVIINSNIMLYFLKYYFEERNFNIDSIELMEADTEYNDICSSYIDKSNKIRESFVECIKELEFLFSDDCIEVFKISLKGKDENKTIRVDIQSNGIVRVNCDKFEEEINKLSRSLENFYG